MTKLCSLLRNGLWNRQKYRMVKFADHILAVDLSEEMLEKAKHKITAQNVKFVQADINKEWIFTENKKYDLATFSLVLEHIENIYKIFKKLSEVLNANGIVYIGELHPFKQ